MQGKLSKMRAKLNNPVEYSLCLDGREIPLNALLGSRITLRATGKIYCIHCGRETKKSFNQGYCYPCFTSLAQCDMCVLKPETCHFEKGTCREPDWGQQHCMQDHFVYLANSSGVKVGITRQSQIPVRWIDQGAIQALPVFKVASRHISGLIEIELAQHVSDKTHWQKMLKNHADEVDLPAKRQELIAFCEEKFASLIKRFGDQAILSLPLAEVVRIKYPVLSYPEKVKSLSFETAQEVAGMLMGIKGQYLILDSGVINLRKFGGYEISFEA